MRGRNERRVILVERQKNRPLVLDYLNTYKIKGDIDNELQIITGGQA